MIPARPALRSTLPRVARCARTHPRQQVRFQSSTSATSSSSHIGAGVAGGVAGAVLFYGVYSFTPAGRTASKINKAAKDAEKKYLAAAHKLQQNTPSADEAVNSIKQFAYSYVGWIPGGRAYVDTAFDDWEKVRQNHREDADQIVNDAYKGLQDLSKSGLSLETGSKALEILADLSKKVANLSADAFSDVIDNHPQLKQKLGGSVDQLKEMGDKYGPEAKKQVDDTWRQVKDIFSRGLDASSLEKARSLIEDKVQQVRKLGDEAWKRGLEEAKPILDKNPNVKELIEKNADALKNGNAKELFDKAKAAVTSGDLGDLEKYVNSTVEAAKSKGSGIVSSGWENLNQYAKLFPQGDQILEKLQQLGEVADKHKDEGEKLLKDTFEELKQVLEDKAKKAEEIASQAKKDI